MRSTVDAAVIGGGIGGTAVAYELARRGLKVALFEKNYLTSGSTGRCITGIRQQFSTACAIRTAMDSVDIFKNMKESLGEDVEWASSGYLFLAYSEADEKLFRTNIALQKSFGLEVDFISSAECKAIVPLLDADGLRGGAWCASDGQANPFLVVKAYADAIRRLGGEIRNHTRIAGIGMKKNRVVSVTTETGDVVSAGIVINAAGPWAAEVGHMAGIELPVEPERHEALVTEPVAYQGIPMLVDYRPDGGYFVQRVTGQFIGCFTPKSRVPGFNTESSLDFLVEMTRRMCRLVPSLRRVAVLRQWAGSYPMTPDGSPWIGPTEIEGLYSNVGFCGHGFMFGPALGFYLARFILDGGWPFPMDEFLSGRAFHQTETMA